MATKAQNSEKSKKGQSSKVEKFYEDKAETTKKNLSQGGKAVRINLRNTTRVKFTDDYGFNKKGTEIDVSDVALEIYTKAGVVEKI